jgi:CheY-like chemotaxis protein
MADEQKRMLHEPLNILLVEDDAVDIMNVQRAFKQKQITFPLTIAQNGLEALTMLRDTVSKREHSHLLSKRRIVLLDLNMPRMNGFEFLKILRQDPLLNRIPVVVLTTSDNEDDRKRAYQFNVAGYILKSVAFPQFAERMAALTHYWSLCEMP